MTDLAGARAALEARLAELSGRAGRIEADLAEPLSADSEEQAVEAEDDQSLERQDILIHTEIRNVKAALIRIDAGTYGECTRCGDEIAAARLAAHPEAALCIACARAREEA